MTPREPAPRMLDRTLLQRLKEFLWPHRSWLWLGVLLLCCGFAADLAGPYIIRQTIDGPVKAVLEEGETSTGIKRQILWSAGLFLAIAIVSACCRYLQTVVMTLVGQRVTFSVRTRLFEHLLRLPMRFFDRRSTGELVTRITSDVENLAELFSSGIASVLFDLLRILGLMVALFWIDWRLAAVVLLGLPFYAFVSVRFRKRARAAYSETRVILARANGFVQDSIAGVNVIQLSGQRPRMEQRFEKRGEELRQAWMKTIRQYATFLPLVDFANQFLVATTFAISGWMILGDEITEGVFIQYWFYLRLMFDPIGQIAERYNVLQSALSSSERILALMNESPESDAGETRPIAGKLDFDRVHFSYEGTGNQALKNVSFQVNPGETVAVVGATGAGKSTLIQLLLGFYHEQAGQVRIDELAVKDWKLQDLRRGFGVVPQDVFLFADTVLENIRLRDQTVSAARVEEACRLVGADSFIKRLQHDYATRLGERGINLSAGQRQLLAFARALVFSPKLVILDEATSSIDSETEAVLQHAVEKIMEGRTAIVIAHRLSTIRRADRILVLHHGQLRESGTHDQLVAQDGIYARLVQLQFGQSG